MSNNKPANAGTPNGAGTILKGNFKVQRSDDPNLTISSAEKSDQTRRTEEFEKAARERIGGSIAFVTQLRDPKKDVLLWDGDEEDK